MFDVETEQSKTNFMAVSGSSGAALALVSTGSGAAFKGYSMKLPNLGEFRVLTLRECAPIENKVCDTPERAAAYWRERIATDPRHNPEVECLIGLVLSTRRHVLGHYIVATGTLDTILAHPREVFRPAILAAAPGIILMHNHPSGDATPSEADIKVTREIIKGGELLKISLVDHLIMGKLIAPRITDYCSLRELGYFYN